MKKTVTTAVLAVLVLTLGGCGGGADEAKAAKSLSDSIMKGQESGGGAELFSLEREDADCIGDGWVEDIGTEQLQKYRLLDEELKAKADVDEVKMSAEDATAATDVLFECADVQAMVKSAINQGGMVPPRVRPCVDETLTENNVRLLFVNLFQGKAEEGQRAVMEPLTKCAMRTTR